MDPEKYRGIEWQDLLEDMTPEEIKKAMRSGLRGTAKQMLKVAQGRLAASGLKVKGDKSDWARGIRCVVNYAKRDKDDGILLTVHPRKGKRARGFHKNRRFGRIITRGPRMGSVNMRELPVLLFAEDGTEDRKTGNRLSGTGAYGKTRAGTTLYRHYKRDGRNTGKMPAYKFLASSESRAGQVMQSNLEKEVEKAVIKVFKKSGFK